MCVCIYIYIYTVYVYQSSIYVYKRMYVYAPALEDAVTTVFMARLLACSSFFRVKTYDYFKQEHFCYVLKFNASFRSTLLSKLRMCMAFIL